MPEMLHKVAHFQVDIEHRSKLFQHRPQILLNMCLPVCDLEAFARHLASRCWSATLFDAEMVIFKNSSLLDKLKNKIPRKIGDLSPKRTTRTIGRNHKSRPTIRQRASEERSDGTKPIGHVGISWDQNGMTCHKRTSGRNRKKLKNIGYMYDGCMMQFDAIEDHCTPVYNCKWLNTLNTLKKNCSTWLRRL